MFEELLNNGIGLSRVEMDELNGVYDKDFYAFLEPPENDSFEGGRLLCIICGDDPVVVFNEYILNYKKKHNRYPVWYEPDKKVLVLVLKYIQSVSGNTIENAPYMEIEQPNFIKQEESKHGSTQEKDGST
jgi:hypothetical protein